MNKAETLEYLEGYINTVTRHKEKATSETQVTLYTGMILGLREAVVLTEKIKCQ